MLNVTVLTVLFYISLKKVKSYCLSQRICIFPTFFSPFFLVGWLCKCQSIKKSGRQTFRERFVSSSLFVSPCPLGMLFPNRNENRAWSQLIHSRNPCEHCDNSDVYGTLIMKCPKSSLHDYYKICLLCDNQIPEDRNYIKEGFLRCHDCGAITHKNAKTFETNF